jgi:hypothetical protein
MPANVPSHVQGFYSTMTGPLLREDGKTRPATLDEVEQNYGQDALDEIMGTSGWVDLVMPGLWQPLPVVLPIVRQVAQIDMSKFEPRKAVAS